MSVEVEKVKSPLVIISVAVAVALIDNIAVAISTSIPWITDVNAHALFMAIVLTMISSIGIAVIGKRENIKFEWWIMFFPVAICIFAFLLDRFVLSYIRSLSIVSFSILGYQIETISGSIFASLTLAVLVIILLILILKILKSR